MENSRTARKSIVTATTFGVIPCVLGLGTAEYLRWSGTVWLSNSGAFWPTVCFLSSLAVLITLTFSSSMERTARVCGWLMVTWTWLYLPLWLTAQAIPQSSAVIPRDGRVFVAGDSARQPSDKVW